MKRSTKVLVGQEIKARKKASLFQAAHAQHGHSWVSLPYHSLVPVLSLLLSPLVLAAAEAKVEVNGEGIA